MLDLGCGTGLGGAAFRPYVDWLVGVDISPAMVAKARSKGLYDRLAVLDLLHFLDVDAQSQARYHLVVAADVFVYVADLKPSFAAIAGALAPNGLLAFSVESHDGEGADAVGELGQGHAGPPEQRHDARGDPLAEPVAEDVDQFLGAVSAVEGERDV